MAKKKKHPPKPLLVDNNHISEDTLTNQQREAYYLINEWLHTKKNKNNMIFRLGGLAGVGKDYLLRYLIEVLGYDQSQCYVTAYTGQAVNVMRQNGILAKTIHSTFMEAYDTILYKDGKPVIKRGSPVIITKFKKRKYIPSTVKLIVVNEASFLPKDFEEMILNYNVPILELGDPFQLPPVAGEQCFNMNNLDYMIEEIMRQEKDSEIIDLATRFRFNMHINISDYCNEVRFLKAQEDIDKTFFRYYPFFIKNDITLTVNNHDRTRYTELYRKYVIKTNSPYPRKGERLICRRNEWSIMIGDYPLTNGTQGYAVHTVSKSDINNRSKEYFLDFRPVFIDNEYYDGLIADGEFLIKPFEDKKADTRFKFGEKKFEYAHAITTHLSQGATYNSIVFMDRYLGYADEEYAARLRYTAITRAKKRVVYIMPYNKYGYYNYLERS
jgi:exodeoxyribonuclease-5